MINQLQQPQRMHQQQMMMGGGGPLIEERDGMTEQEMIAMQEAIMAQMQQDTEDIYIDEEDDAS